MEMRDFRELSGPWVGQSLQEGFRITESIVLTIDGCSVRGQGTDSDGDFDLVGEYDPSDDRVMLERRYNRSPKNPEQVGYAFIYLGRWDGTMVSGRWMMSTQPSYGDGFEMWPQREDVALETQFEFEERVEPMAIC